MTSIGKLDTRGYWAVNGTPIYVPDDIQIEHDNIVTPESGRTESGKMRITWVRRDVVKVELGYKYLTGAEVDYMKNLMQGKEFTFTYYDNGIQRISAYCGKCSYGQKNLGSYTDAGGLYDTFKINAVEM